MLDKVPSLADGSAPLFVCGVDPDNFYKSINGYYVDRNGKIYLWDYSRPYDIDVYDSSGQFEFKFGTKGEGPSEFHAVYALAVDSRGNIWVSADQRTLKVFSSQGVFLKDILLPAEMAGSFMQKIEFNGNGELVLLSSTNSGEASIYLWNPEKGSYSLMNRESRRIRASFVNFIPDFDIGRDGNIYVTDTFDYRLYKFSEKGALLGKLEAAKFKPDRIVESDFYLFDENLRVYLFPRYKEILNQLTGPSRYFPAVFGVNLDQGRIYVWTWERDGMSRYIVDIYDMNFDLVGHACYFNWVRRNLARIRNGRLYIPSIENTNAQLARQAGRLGRLNIPDQFNVYAISPLLKKSS